MPYGMVPYIPSIYQTYVMVWYGTVSYDKFKLFLLKKVMIVSAKVVLLSARFFAQMQMQSWSIFTWSKTKKLHEWLHDWTQFPADEIMTSRLLTYFAWYICQTNQINDRPNSLKIYVFHLAYESIFIKLSSCHFSSFSALFTIGFTLMPIRYFVYSVIKNTRYLIFCLVCAWSDLNTSHVNDMVHQRTNKSIYSTHQKTSIYHTPKLVTTSKKLHMTTVLQQVCVDEANQDECQVNFLHGQSCSSCCGGCNGGRLCPQQHQWSPTHSSIP